MNFLSDPGSKDKEKDALRWSRGASMLLENLAAGLCLTGVDNRLVEF